MPATNHGRSSFDTIVVGAGTAGCIVAARLAERGERVLLLEAGGPYRRILDVPLLGLWAWLRTPAIYCWNQYTAPQAALDGRSVWFPGGRITGGSSAINAMIYTRGHPASYERWGVPGWSYQDVLPYHKRAEHFEGGASEFHGASGPLGVSNARYRYPLADAFIRACEALGMPRTDDFNGPDSHGVGYYSLSQRSGRRSVPGKTYLAMARRHAGFRHDTDAFVTSLVMDGTRVQGVRWTRAGREEIASAGRVILCAGTVRTPQLLMLSGLGPAADLRPLGIPVVVDLPGVGASLQDQLRVPVAVRHRTGSPTRPDRLAAAAWHYLSSRRGLLASNVCDAAAVASLTGGEVPDVRVAFRWRVFPETGLPLVDFEVAGLQPQSRGRVSLRSANPDDAPTIDPAYLSVSADVDALTGGIALARRIAAHDVLRAAGLESEHAPGTMPVDEHIRRFASTAYHPVGTCRMGLDDAAVVDPELSVRGVERLHIADASIIPSCVSANAQATVVAVAEKAADLFAR